MTVLLLGATVYISGLLSSSTPPTQIQKTKAAAKTYSRTVVIPDFITSPTTVPTVAISPTLPPAVTKAPTAVPTDTKAPTSTPPLLAQVPTSIPTIVPTNAPLPTITIAPTLAPTHVLDPTNPPVTPTLQPLLAYKSTSISPTMGSVDPTNAPSSVPSPTKKVQPTGVQQLPETGWIQTSSILFIVAASTILFSLLF